MTPKWKLVLQGEAINEVASLLSGRDERPVRNALRLLIAEDDPRHPSKPDLLDIAHVEHHAPGWYRLKLYEQNIRIVFRLIRKYDQNAVEYRVDEMPWEGDHANEVAVMQAAYRNKDFYTETRRRWKQYH